MCVGSTPSFSSGKDVSFDAGTCEAVVTAYIDIPCGSSGWTVSFWHRMGAQNAFILTEKFHSEALPEGPDSVEVSATHPIQNNGDHYFAVTIDCNGLAHVTDADSVASFTSEECEDIDIPTPPPETSEPERRGIAELIYLVKPTKGVTGWTYEDFRILTGRYQMVDWFYYRNGGCGNFQLILRDDFPESNRAVKNGWEIHIRAKVGTSTEYVTFYRGVIRAVEKKYQGQEVLTLVRGQGYVEQLSNIQVQRRYPRGLTIKQIVDDIVKNYILPDTRIVDSAKTNGSDATANYTTQGPIHFECSALKALKVLSELQGDFEFGIAANREFYFREKKTTFEHSLFFEDEIVNVVEGGTESDKTNKIKVAGKRWGHAETSKIISDVTDITEFGMFERPIESPWFEHELDAQRWAQNTIDIKKTPSKWREFAWGEIDKRLESNHPDAAMAPIRVYGVDVSNAFVDLDVTKIHYLKGGFRHKAEIREIRDVKHQSLLDQPQFRATVTLGGHTNDLIEELQERAFDPLEALRAKGRQFRNPHVDVTHPDENLQDVKQGMLYGIVDADVTNDPVRLDYRTAGRWDTLLGVRYLDTIEGISGEWPGQHVFAYSDAPTRSEGELYYWTGSEWVLTSGGGQISVGDAIGGAGAWNVLHVDGSGALRFDAGFTFDGSVLTVPSLNITDATNQITFDSDGANPGVLTIASLTGSRTWTLPNSSGTLALLSGSPTSDDLELVGSTPSIVFENTAAGLDEKVWVLSASSTGHFRLDLKNDAGSSAANLFLVSRTLETPDYIQINAAVYLSEGQDVSAPALAWPTDPDSGRYRINSDAYGESVAGALKWWWNGSYFFYRTPIVVGTGAVFNDAYIYLNGPSTTNPNIRLAAQSGGFTIYGGNSNDTFPPNDSYTQWISLTATEFTLVLPDFKVRNSTGTITALHADSTTGVVGVGNDFNTSYQLNIETGGADSRKSVRLRQLFTGSLDRRCEIYLNSDGDLNLDLNTGGATFNFNSPMVFSGDMTATTLSLTANSNQIIFDSDGAATGTLTWSPSSSSKTITLPNATGTVPLGTGAANQVAYWSGTNAVTGSANLTFDGTDLVLGANQALGIGVAPEAVASTNPLIYIEAADGATDIIQTSYRSSGSPGSGVIGRSSRGSKGAPGTLNTDDLLLFLGGRGHDGTSWQSGSGTFIRMKAHANWTTSSKPTYIDFGTTSVGATGGNVRLKIHEDGEIEVPHWINIGSNGSAAADGDFFAGNSSEVFLFLDESTGELKLDNNTASDSDIVFILDCGSAAGARGQIEFRHGGTVKGIIYSDVSDTSLNIRPVAGYNLDLWGEGEASRIRINATETVINQGHLDRDFRVEGDTADHLLFVQASSGSENVGINTTSPDRKLDVLDAVNPQLRLTHTDGSVYTEFQTDSSGRFIMQSSGALYRMAYDASNYVQFQSASDGDLQVNLIGSSANQFRWRGDINGVLASSVRNINAGASGSCVVVVENDGGDDAYFRVTLTGGVSFAYGIDNSASGAFRLCNAATLGTTGLALEIDTNEVVTVTQLLRVGTATDAAAQGDFSAGLTGAARLFYDQSTAVFDLHDSTGARAIRLNPAGETVFNEQGNGSQDIRMEGDTLSHMFFTDVSANTENIALLATAAPNWQSMDRGLFVGDATTAPTGDPTSGGFLYSESGALKWRGSSGTITTLGAADPHCPNCGADFMHEWENWKYGYLAVCMKCLTDEIGNKPWILRDKKLVA